MSTNIRATIEDDVYARLKDFCDKSRRPLSNAVNVLLDDRLRELESDQRVPGHG